MGCLSAKPAETDKPGQNADAPAKLDRESVYDKNGKRKPSRALTLNGLPEDTIVLNIADEELQTAQAEYDVAIDLINRPVSALINRSTPDDDSTPLKMIGSKTEEDPDKLGKFKQKALSKLSLGADVDTKAESLGEAGLACTCRKGLKPESPNQDAFFVCRMSGSLSVYGVFDGHGEFGHSVAEFVNDFLPKWLIHDDRIESRNFDKREKMLQDAFEKTQTCIQAASTLRAISARASGTTSTVVVQDHKSNMLTVAHVGDSAAVLGRTMLGNDKLMAVELTQDHKPQLNIERMRIEQAGGYVRHDGHMSFRVYARGSKYPGLNMSRCLGDLDGHANAGLSAIPDVTEHEVGPSDKVLLVCSDGVWTFIEPQEAMDIISQYEQAEDALKAADALAKEAWERWMLKEQGHVVDDITVIVVFLHYKPEVPARHDLMSETTI